jgi:hypothetical protein
LGVAAEGIAEVGVQAEAWAAEAVVAAAGSAALAHVARGDEVVLAVASAAEALETLVEQGWRVLATAAFPTSMPGLYWNLSAHSKHKYYSRALD